MSEKSMLEGVKNCLMRNPKVRMTFGLASNNFIYLLSNTASSVGCLGSDLILDAYCRDTFARLSPGLGLVHQITSFLQEKYKMVPDKA